MVDSAEGRKTHRGLFECRFLWWRTQFINSGATVRLVLTEVVEAACIIRGVSVG